MKVYSVVIATLMLSGSLVYAQVCPPTSAGSVCLVPSRNAAAATLPYTMMTAYGASTTVPYSSCGQAACIPVCPTATTCNVSRDTGCILNELTALRNEMRATRGQVLASSLMAQGAMIIARLNELQSDEMAFRVAFTGNQSLPESHAIATKLQSQINAINQDIAAFNQALAAIPADMRPYLAGNLSTFDTAYWTPALQRFAAYSNQFQQSNAYQTQCASLSWMPNWKSDFQTALNTVAASPTTYACSRWWVNMPTVAGSTETLSANAQAVTANGMTLVTPNGSTIFIPAGSMPLTNNNCSACAAATPCIPICPTATVAPCQPTCATPCPCQPSCGCSGNSSCGSCNNGCNSCNNGYR